MVVVHVVVAATDIGTTLEAAALILTIIGVTNTSGKILMGALATKFGNRIVLSIALTMQIVGLLYLATADKLYVFYIIVPIYGFFYGAIIPIQPALVWNFFGGKAMGSIFGIVNIAYTIGGAVGPLLAGYIFDVTGSYYAAFLSAATATAAALLLSLLLRQP